MSLTTELEKPSGKPVYLVETTAMKTVKFWESAIDALDPLSAGDCVLLVDAREETAYADGDPVPTVQDFSGVVGNFTQVTANKRATYVANAQNGAPAFNFVGNDGIGDIYSRAVADLSVPFAADEITYIMAVKWSSADQDSCSIFGGRNPDDTNRLGLQVNGNMDFPLNTFRAWHSGAGMAEVANPAGFSDTFHIIVARRSGTNWKIYVDGVLILNQTVAGDFSPTGAGTLWFGGFADDFHIHWTGQAGVFAVYKKALDDELISQVTKDLGDSYGVALPLISGSLWRANETRRVVEVKHNGTVLTKRTSSGDVQALGGWHWDRTHIYVALSDNADPRSLTDTVVLTLQFEFSTDQKTLDGRWWDARLLAVPDLSLRIEQDFSGVSQVGSGAFKFGNADGFFTPLMDLDWDAGRTALKLGFDTETTEMVYADYEDAGVWVNGKVFCSNIEFTLSVKEIKSKLETQIPFTFYNRTDYPVIPEGEIGRGVQIVYGQVFGAAPVCISIELKKFQLAGHAIYSVTEVRQKTADLWKTVAIENLDLTAATFTVPGWDGESSISVDFKGKLDGSGNWISNAADMIEDMLDMVGVSIHAGSFAESRNALIVATTLAGGENCSRVPSIYLDEAVEIREVIEKINKLVGSYLFVDFSGDFRYVVFRPKPGENLRAFTSDFDFLDPDFSEETDDKQEVSSVKATYARRLCEEWEQIVFETKAANQHSKAEGAPITMTAEFDLSNISDATCKAQRVLRYEGTTQKTRNLKLGWIGLTLLPSDQVRLVYPGRDLNVVQEIIETKLSIGGLKKIPSVALYLGDLHGIRDRCGFVVSDLDELPARFAGMSGFGAGELTWNDAWDPEIKTWARQNVAYVSDNNGFAKSVDVESYLAGTVL